MNEGGAINGVLAVITRIMVPASHIDRAAIHKWVKACCHVAQLRSRVPGIVLIIGALLFQRLIGGFEFSRCVRHFRRPGMARSMFKSRIRHNVVGTAALMVNSERVGPRKGSGYFVSDEKRERTS